ncbi:10691_t:CDS:2, partial [Cetraspora pellucida]
GWQIDNTGTYVFGADNGPGSDKKYGGKKQWEQYMIAEVKNQAYYWTGIPCGHPSGGSDCLDDIIAILKAT